MSFSSHMLKRSCGLVSRRLVASSSAMMRTPVHLHLSSTTTMLRQTQTTTTTPLACRSFSTHRDNLMDILAREHQEEVDSGNLEIPGALADLQSDLENNGGWKIVSDGAITNMYLTSKKVQVSFHCQDTIEDADDYEEEEDDEEPVPSVRFTVTQARAGKCLVVNGIAEYGQVKIEGVATTASTPETIHAGQGHLPKAEYQGPEFLELAEDLQDGILDYLAEIGIDDDVAAFIGMKTDYQEQQHYVQFLKDAQAVIG